MSPDDPCNRGVTAAKERSKLGLRVGVVNPHPPARRSRALQPTFFKQIRASVLAACQFPPVLRNARGEIRKPARW
jgi:hypothetical protein